MGEIEGKDETRVAKCGKLLKLYDGYSILPFPHLCVLGYFQNKDVLKREGNGNAIL